jgi:urease accessory protein UreF
MADLGVFVTDATKEVEKLNAARELVQAFMQNGGQFSMALETLESDNFVELKQKIQQAEQGTDGTSTGAVRSGIPRTAGEKRARGAEAFG